MFLLLRMLSICIQIPPTQIKIWGLFLCTKHGYTCLLVKLERTRHPDKISSMWKTWGKVITRLANLKELPGQRTTWRHRLMHSDRMLPSIIPGCKCSKPNANTIPVVHRGYLISTGSQTVGASLILDSELWEGIFGATTTSWNGFIFDTEFLIKLTEDLLMGSMKFNHKN